jgi:hypothetical protein
MKGKKHKREIFSSFTRIFPGSLAGKTKLMLSLPEWHEIKGNYSLGTYSLSRRECITSPIPYKNFSIHGKFLRKLFIYAKIKSVCLKDSHKKGTIISFVGIYETKHI